MSDLPNWIKAVDNVEKIKELGKMSIQYFNDRGYFILANEQINEIHNFTESLIDKV